MKKTGICCAVLSALLLCGCAGAGENAFSASAPQPAGASAAATEDKAAVAPFDGAPGGEGGYYGMLYVGEGQEAETNIGAVSEESDTNAVLVQGGGLVLNGAEIRKTGDATGTAASGGGNAALAAVAGGQLTLQGGAVETNGFGAHALFATGANTYLLAENATVVVSGGTSAAAFATEAGEICVRGGSLTVLDTSGTSPAILLGGGGAVTLEGTLVICGAGGAAEVMEGKPFLTLASQTLTGDILLGEDTGVDLSLTEGSRYEGAFTGDGMADITVRLSADSAWTLTADTEINVLIDADETLQNIQSNGFSLTYNAESAENAWLHRGAFELPGGGFLTPSI